MRIPHVTAAILSIGGFLGLFLIFALGLSLLCLIPALAAVVTAFLIVL